MKNRFFTNLLTAFLFIGVIIGFSSLLYAGKSDNSLSFKRMTVTDDKGFGYKVFEILVPDKWDFSGQVNWQFPGGLPHPVLTWQVSDPDQQVYVQRYPDMIFHWSNDQMMLQTYQANMAPIANPMSASDFLTQMFLPWRNQGQTSQKIISQKELPQLAESWKSIQEYLLLQVYHPISPLPSRPVFETEAILAELQSGSNRMNEQFIVLINRVYLTITGMYGPVHTVAWNAIVTSFMAPEKNKVKMSVPFGIMMRSAKLNPRWGIDCTRLTAVCVRNMLRQQQRIFDAMRKISQTRSDTGDMIMDGWKRRNASMDRVYDKFSDYMRDSEPYHDPVQDMTVDIPNRYENAWTNGLEYVFSENPAFNPNRTSDTRNWTRMDRVR